jgi:predicted benzoate:H+ symporter BenE
MITFLVTVSNIHILKLGAPFWGLVAGVFAHWIIVAGSKIGRK